jgi:hypothetical protein
VIGTRSIQSDVGDTQSDEVPVRVVVERRRACRIRRVARRDEDDHSLSSSGQQDTIRVQQVALPVFLVNGRPRISPERLIPPRVCVAPEVGVPCHADPIELEPLNLEFSCRVLEVIARSRIVPVVEEPLDRIDVHADIDRMRLESLGLRRGDKAVSRGQGTRIRRDVAKDAESTYRSGSTRSWVKCKIRHEGRFVVGGIVGLPYTFAGLLVGQRAGRRLLYRGTVEWGLGLQTAQDLVRRGRERSTSPFHDFRMSRGVVWLEPTLEVDLTYSEVMEGRLRDPVYRGLA